MAQQSIFHVRQRSSGRLEAVGPMIYKTATTVPPYWHKAIYAMTVSSPSSPTNRPTPRPCPRRPRPSLASSTSRTRRQRSVPQHDLGHESHRRNGSLDFRPITDLTTGSRRTLRQPRQFAREHTPRGGGDARRDQTPAVPGILFSRNPNLAEVFRQRVEAQARTWPSGTSTAAAIRPPPESATSGAQVLTGSVSAPGAAALDTPGETRGPCLIVIDDDDEASLGLYKTLLRERNGYSHRAVPEGPGIIQSDCGRQTLFFFSVFFFSPFPFSFSIFPSLLRSGRGRGRWVPSFGLLLTAGLRQAEPWS